MNESQEPVQAPAATAAVVNVAKGKSTFLTFEYAAAAASTVAAVGSIAAAINYAFSLWTSSSDLMGFGLLGGNIYLLAITSVVSAIIFSLLAWFFFARVSRAIPERKGYTSRTAYKVITYGLYGVLLAGVATSTISLLSVLISSLVLIGTDTNIGTLYLGTFLPQLLIGAVAATAAYFVYRIVGGRNTSKLLTLVLLGLSGALFVAHIITVAIHSHSDSSPSSSIREQLDDYDFEW